MAGIISKIKQSVQNTGLNREKIVSVPSDKKIRLRFLQDFDKGKVFTMHNDWDSGINAICREHYGEDCKFCGDDSIKTQDKYAWSVWNVDAKEVQIFLWQATSRSPVNQLLEYYETYGTIMDRDFVISRKGVKFDTIYQVIAMDKSKFRNEKAKPFSEETMLKILDKAFPPKAYKPKDEEDDDEDDEEEEEKPKSKKKAAAKKPAKKKPPVDDDEDEDEDEEEEKPKSKKKQPEKKSTKKGPTLEIDWIEEKLESEDIDEEEFCEYFEIMSISKLTTKTKKEVASMIKEFIASLDDDEDEDDEDEDED